MPGINGLTVDLGFGFSIENHQSIQRQSLHLVLARIDVHGSYLLHMILDETAEALVVGHTAREEDGVHIHAESRGCKTTDFFSHLIGHGFVDFLPFLVASFHGILHFESVVGAKISDKAAFAFQHLADFFLGVLAAKASVDKETGRQSASAFGREGTIAIQGIVSIDHAAFLVGTDRDAATKVDGDDVHVLIFATEVFGQLTGDDLLVQGMEDRDAREKWVTRLARHLVHFVDHDRVGNVSLHTNFLGNVVGNQAAEVGSVFAVVALHEVLNHEIVHFVDT